MPGGPLQIGEDVLRVFMSSAMGGIPETYGRYADENRQKLAAARGRLGIVGDGLSVAGMLGGGVGAIKGGAALVKSLPKLGKAVGAVGRAVPAAERAVTRAVVPGAAGRATARARLGLPELPTISQRAASAVRAHPIRATAGAAAFGGGTAVSHNYRTYDEVNAAPASAPAASAPAPAMPRMNSNEMSPWVEPPARSQASSFDAMVEQAARANGGGLSLRQMSALAEIAQRTAPRGRQPTYKDVIAQQLLAGAEQSLQAEHAIADEISRTDPAAGAKYGQRATEKYLGSLRSIMGVEPSLDELVEAARGVE